MFILLLACLVNSLVHSQINVLQVTVKPTVDWSKSNQNHLIYNVTELIKQSEDYRKNLLELAKELYKPTMYDDDRFTVDCDNDGIWYFETSKSSGSLLSCHDVRNIQGMMLCTFDTKIAQGFRIIKTSNNFKKLIIKGFPYFENEKLTLRLVNSVKFCEMIYQYNQEAPEGYELEFSTIMRATGLGNRPKLLDNYLDKEPENEEEQENEQEEEDLKNSLISERDKLQLEKIFSRAKKTKGKIKLKSKDANLVRKRRGVQCKKRTWSNTVDCTVKGFATAQEIAVLQKNTEDIKEGFLDYAKRQGIENKQKMIDINRGFNTLTKELKAVIQAGKKTYKFASKTNSISYNTLVMASKNFFSIQLRDWMNAIKDTIAISFIHKVERDWFDPEVLPYKIKNKIEHEIEKEDYVSSVECHNLFVKNEQSIECLFHSSKDMMKELEIQHLIPNPNGTLYEKFYIYMKEGRCFTIANRETEKVELKPKDMIRATIVESDCSVPDETGVYNVTGMPKWVKGTQMLNSISFIDNKIVSVSNGNVVPGSLLSGITYRRTSSLTTSLVKAVNYPIKFPNWITVPTKQGPYEKIVVKEIHVNTSAITAAVKEEASLKLSSSFSGGHNFKGLVVILLSICCPCSLLAVTTAISFFSYRSYRYKLSIASSGSFAKTSKKVKVLGMTLCYKYGGRKEIFRGKVYDRVDDDESRRFLKQKNNDA